MAFSISTLSITPDTISSGTTPCSIYFNGNSMGTGNTAVDVTFTIDIGSPVNFCDASGKIIGKSINQSYSFTNTDTKFVNSSFFYCTPPSDNTVHLTPLAIKATENATGLVSNYHLIIYYHN